MVHPTVFNMHELLLTYTTKNLRNYDFVCLLKGIFAVSCKYQIARYPAFYFQYPVSGRILKKTGCNKHLKNQMYPVKIITEKYIPDLQIYSTRPHAA